MIMTYDEYYSNGPVGPVASAPWVDRVVRYATTQIPSGRLMLGIAGYGYEWPGRAASGGGRALPARRAVEAVRSGEVEGAWDRRAEVPTYRRGERVGYFEDADSTAFKLELVRRHRLAGVALWRLGYEDARIWDDLARRTPRGGGAVARRP